MISHSITKTRVLPSFAMTDAFSDAARKLPHRVDPKPLHFPVEECVPETTIHLSLRTFLYLLLDFVLRGRAKVQSDQFVYFDASNPRRCLAPDTFVKMGDLSSDLIPSWKVWERGAPELCVEFDSPGDEATWERRFANYRALGVRELVRFAPDAREGERLRVWDRIDEDLVERVVEGDATPCLVLGWHWVVRPIPKAPVGLRLAEDAAGERLVLTELEHARVESDRRIAELEAELRRRGG